MITFAVTDHCKTDKIVAPRRQPYRSAPDSEIWGTLSPTTAQPPQIGTLKLVDPPKSRFYQEPKIR